MVWASDIEICLLSPYAMATFRGGGVSSIEEFYISTTVRSCMNPSYKNAQKKTICVESAKHSSQPVAGKMCSLPFVYQLLSSKFVREADGFNVAASIGISARNRHPCMRGMVGTGEMSTSANKKKHPDTKRPHCVRLERKLLPHVQVQKHRHTDNMQLSDGV